MRWCLFIINFLILLTLGIEQCGWCATAGVKDASHLVCVLDDDEADLKQDLACAVDSLSPCDPPAMPGWHEVIRRTHAGLVEPLTGAESCKVPTGIRRHRWLCQERC